VVDLDLLMLLAGSSMAVYQDSEYMCRWSNQIAKAACTTAIKLK